MMEREYIHVTHTFSPVVDENCRILILGSFPSVKSRENGFYYGHPSNRFWKVLAAVLEMDVPGTIEEKKVFLLSHHIALWDVIFSCDIRGSSDAHIRNAVPQDIPGLLQKAPIQAIFCNGATAERLYTTYCFQQTGISAHKLPSTSPANAVMTLEKLIPVWKEAILPFLCEM